jgi:hypothetical protein
MPFTWGSHDCLTFAGAVVKALTDEDLVKDFPAYDTEFGAGRILVEYGSVEALLTAKLGEPIDAKFAQRGDLVLLDLNETGPAASVCVGIVAYGPGLNGLEIVPMSRASKAWRI